MTTLYYGKIHAFYGSWSSGLATLAFKDGKQVYSDSGPLGRALDGAFDAATHGHSIDNDKIEGQEIIYWMDEMGLTMAGFIKYDEYLDKGYPKPGPEGIDSTTMPGNEPDESDESDEED